MTHSMSAKLAFNEWAMEDRETATILESRLIMKDGMETHSRISKRCVLSRYKGAWLLMIDRSRKDDGFKEI